MTERLSTSSTVVLNLEQKSTHFREAWPRRGSLAGQPLNPVHHQLPEFTQTHAHRVSDAIQPSHPLSSPSPPAPIPPSIRVFSNESTLHMRWPKYWGFSFSTIPSKEHPGLTSFRIDWVGSPCSPRDMVRIAAPTTAPQVRTELGFKYSDS